MILPVAPPLQGEALLCVLKGAGVFRTGMLPLVGIGCIAWRTTDDKPEAVTVAAAIFNDGVAIFF